jgi:hypothetical protein
VRPGGRLAVTTWGTQVFEPVTSLLWDVVAQRRPDLVRQPAWQRITTPDALRALLAEAGIPDGCVRISVESDRQPMAGAEDFWTVILGTGYRAVVDAMSAPDAEWLRTECLAGIGGAASMDSEVIYAVARRPA